MALQRRLAGYTDTEAEFQIRQRFLDMMCVPNRDVAFFVGDQAKRVHVVSVLGIFYPQR